MHTSIRRDTLTVQSSKVFFLATSGGVVVLPCQTWLS
jgi:hypothetical protein